ADTVGTVFASLTTDVSKNASAKKNLINVIYLLMREGHSSKIIEQGKNCC
ncbi:hypothetical protein BN1182_BM_00010, partial [Pantoea ananatis]